MSKSSSPRANRTSEAVNVVKQFKTRAKINAVNLFKACLKESAHLSELEQEDVVASVLTALEVPDIEDEVSKHAEDGDKRVVNSYMKTDNANSNNSDNKRKRALSVDEHNDLCEVCETGGDLLCCDTCSLVFHLKCIRPKLASVPKGHWSCARCIVDELADGDIDQAKKAIRNMSRLGCGGKDNEANKSKISKELENIIVAQSGRKFAVRQTEDTQNIELGRFATIKEAFSFINDLSKPKRVSVKPIKTKSKRKTVTHREESSSEGEDGNEDFVGGESTVADDDDDELWCTNCLDDDTIIACAFCGCKKCFGKFDSDLLILCDHCDQEIHTYCFDPPLADVPSEDPWYCCESCSVQANDLIDLNNEERTRLGDDMSDDDNSVVETSINPKSRSYSQDHHVDGVTLSSSPRLNGFQLHNPNEANSGIHSRRDSIVSIQSFNSQSSPHASSTANSAATGGVPVHRGRGRPPSAHKRSLSNLSAASNEGVVNSLSNAVNGTHETSTTSFASPLPIEIPKALNTNTSMASVVAAANNVNKSVNVDNALSIVGKSSRRCFTGAEYDNLEQLRQWAPLTDLERVMQALLRQKMSLLDRIRAIDPNIFLNGNDQLYSIASTGYPPNGSMVPNGSYLNPLQHSYTLPPNYFAATTNQGGVVNGGYDINGVPTSINYNAMQYTFVDPNTGEMQMPFEVPSAKPKRKHSKKSPGGESTLDNSNNKRFRSDGTYVMDGSTYAVVPDGSGGMQYVNQYGTYPVTNAVYGNSTMYGTAAGGSGVGIGLNPIDSTNINTGYLPSLSPAMMYPAAQSGGVIYSNSVTATPASHNSSHVSHQYDSSTSYASAISMTPLGPTATSSSSTSSAAQ